MHIHTHDYTQFRVWSSEHRSYTAHIHCSKRPCATLSSIYKTAHLMSNCFDRKRAAFRKTACHNSHSLERFNLNHLWFAVQWRNTRTLQFSHVHGSNFSHALIDRYVLLICTNQPYLSRLFSWHTANVEIVWGSVALSTPGGYSSACPNQNAGKALHSTPAKEMRSPWAFVELL